MFDTMTMTKILGAFCGALCIFLLGKWAADTTYGFYGHDKHHAASYVIETDEGEVGEIEEVVQVAFADVYATADASRGERLWRQCSACHALEAGKNGTGPYLHGVVNRAKHSVDGYDYSEGLMALPGDWTPEDLNQFIESPRSYAEGTKMAYNGMGDVEDRANLIAYMATFQ